MNPLLFRFLLHENHENGATKVIFAGMNELSSQQPVIIISRVL